MTTLSNVVKLPQMKVPETFHVGPLFTQMKEVFFPAQQDLASNAFTPQQLHYLWFPKLTDATEHIIQTKLGRINVTYGGKRDGPAMLLWPSLMMKGSMWSYQYEHFMHTHFVVLIDSPGIGKSQALRKYIDLEDCAQVAVDILDALRIEKCIFGGNSWGAMLASVIPIYAPGRIIASMVINGTASLPTMHETVLMTILGTMLEMNETVPDWWVHTARVAFGSDQSTPEFIAYCGAVSQEDPKSVAAAIRAILLGRTNNDALLKENTTIPVLVLAGGSDRQFSVPTCTKMADAMPTAKFVVVPGVGHLASREKPDVINKEIETFLADIDTA